MGIDVFQRFFEQVVDLCQEAGLVWGRELYFDATKVEANAGIPSLVPRFYYEAKTHVADLFADEADDACTATPTTTCLQASCRCRSTPRRVPAAGDPPWRLLEERRLDPHRPSHRGYRRTSDFRVSPTDPDASPMWDWGAIRLGYHDHYVVDGGKRRIILAALVTPADVMESQAMRDLLWRVCFRRKIWPHQVTGDAKYGTIENIVAIEDAGIRAYVPLTDFEHRTDFYGQDDFTYDAERDEYRCPQGHPLRRVREPSAPRASSSTAADAAICNACPVKAKCTTSDHGRMVQRSFYADYLEKVRGYHATEAYKKAIRKRQVWVEPLFAEAKEWHGLRRLRLRGLLNANIQGLLIAAGQNLKRFLAATGWGRRHAPCGSLVALPREPGPLGPLRVTMSSTGTRASSAGRTRNLAHASPHQKTERPGLLYDVGTPLLLRARSSGSSACTAITCPPARTIISAAASAACRWWLPRMRTLAPALANAGGAVAGIIVRRGEVMAVQADDPLLLARRSKGVPTS